MHYSKKRHVIIRYENFNLLGLSDNQKGDKIMRYSKLLIIFTLLLFAYCPTIGLATDSRYENIVVGDTIVAQFDKETLRYEKDPYRNEQLLSVWIKTFSNSDKDAYSLTHYLFRLHDREMMTMDIVEYNKHGQVTDNLTNKYDPASWSQILPETLPETGYVATLKYSQNNNDQLQSDYNERMKKRSNRNIFSIFTDIYNIGSQNRSESED
jgi:hypothetical protein